MRSCVADGRTDGRTNRQTGRQRQTETVRDRKTDRLTYRERERDGIGFTGNTYRFENMDGRQVNTRRTIHRLSGADKMVFFFLPTKLKRRRRKKKGRGRGD